MQSETAHACAREGVDGQDAREAGMRSAPMRQAAAAESAQATQNGVRKGAL